MISLGRYGEEKRQVNPISLHSERVYADDSRNVNIVLFMNFCESLNALIIRFTVMIHHFLHVGTFDAAKITRPFS